MSRALFQQASLDAPATPASEAEAWASLAVLTQLGLLGLALVGGHFLQRRGVGWLGTPAAALLLGTAVGAVVRYSKLSATYQSWVTFKKEFFFIALLPSIIFDAGFSLQVKPFFANVGGICAFAFVGTTISTVVIGFILWLAGVIHLCIRFTFKEALLYGSIISATDPVTVLAVFQRLQVDNNLYALVLGESVLNDAVALVLYGTIRKFLERPVSAAAMAAGIFMGTFIGSMLIGCAFAVIVSLALKTKYLRSDHMPLESCLVVLVAFSSYCLADGLALSGIVSVLFCSMVMAHYARPNMSRAARDRTVAFFRVLASLAETFVFIYIGACLFLKDQAWDRGLTWSFIVIAMLALAPARAANVYPLAALVNYLRPHELHIPASHKFMLWFSGLRGAIAFALSLDAEDDLPGASPCDLCTCCVHQSAWATNESIAAALAELRWWRRADEKGRVLLTCSLFIVLVTVLFNGGACTYLVQRLRLTEEASLEAQALTRSVAYAQVGSAGEFTAAPGDDESPTAAHGTPGEYSACGTPSTPRRSAGAFLQKGISRVREMNKGGVLSKLEALDRRYLQRYIMADPAAASAIELSQLNAGDYDEADQRPATPRCQLVGPAALPATNGTSSCLHQQASHSDVTQTDSSKTTPAQQGPSVV